MQVFIKAITYALPDKEVTNEDLVSEFPEWSVEKIVDKIGIETRYIATEDETSADLALKAANLLFQENPDIKKEAIDFVLFCTQSPDYFLPTSACLIQDKLGLPTSCGALDFNLGCSGYVYGLAIAKGLIYGGIATNVLLLTGETYSKFIHAKDKGNKTIFGDAGSATLIATEGFAEIGNFSLGTDGRGADNLIVKTGGLRTRKQLNDLQFDENGNPYSSDHLFMNGTEIFNFTIDAVPPMIEDTLIKNSLTHDNVSGYIFHQANKFIINYLRKKIKIEPEKFLVYMANVGNTVSNTIPIVIVEKMKEQKLIGNIVLAGFGVGYSWGGCSLKFSD